MKKSNAKLNNKGFTLIELIVASFVSVIVLLILVTFLVLALKEFHMTSSRTTIQQETQIVQGQMGNLIMEAVSIGESEESTGYEGYIIKTGEKEFKLVYDTLTQRLLLADQTATSAEVMAENPKAYLMAENISAFTLTPSNVNCKDEKAKVAVKLTVEIDGRTMDTDNTYAMRNGIW